MRFQQKIFALSLILTTTPSAFASEGTVVLKETKNSSCVISYFTRSQNPLLAGWKMSESMAASKEECKQKAANVLGSQTLQNERLPIVNGTASVKAVKFTFTNAGETTSGEFELRK